MAMSKKDRTQLLGLLIAVGVLLPVALWFLWRTEFASGTAALQQERDSLRTRVTQARTALRSGTLEQLEATVAAYGEALGAMRQLVPENNEVTVLLDSITTRAQMRGVTVVSVEPQQAMFNGPYEVQRFELVVLGPYDQIGEFFSDVASLTRIMVPVAPSIEVAEPQQLAGMLVEGNRTYLRVGFEVRTFVKSAAAQAQPAPGQEGAADVF